MAINEWKLWIKLGVAKERKEETIDVEKDLKAVNDFLKGVNTAVKNIQPLLKQFSNLRKQQSKLLSAKTGKKALKKNLESQIRLFDRIMKQYQFFDVDEDISAARIRKIAKALKQSAEKLIIDEKLMDKIKTDEKWTYRW
jgi:hypothetical protein